MSEPRLQENELLEELSAFIDGELDAERSRFLQQRLSHDAELRARYERWQMLSSAMRRQGQPAPAGFADRVADAIGKEATAAPAPVRRSRALRWGGGFALAASVALAALFGWRGTQVPAPAKPPAVAVAPAPILPIQRTELPLPEPVVKLPIPVRAGVVTAFRSPSQPILVREPPPAKRPNFDPFPQPYAIDPELEAYLQSQKTGTSPHDVPGPSPSNGDNAVRTVAWPEDPQR